MNVEKKEYIAKFLICAYLVLKPFYLLDLPFQLSDIVLVVLFVYLAFARYVNYIITAEARSGFQYYVCFMVFAILVNAAWYLYAVISGNILADTRFLVSSVYYIFNGVAIVVILWLYEFLGEELIRVFVYGSFASCMITVLHSVILRDEEVSRQIAGFQNPNQLGYYAVIIMTIAILWGGNILTETQLLLMLAGSVYLNLISLSKAGIMACLIMLVLCWLYRSGNRRIFSPRVKGVIVLGGICIGLGLILLEMVGNDKSVLTTVLQRLLYMRDENDTNLGEGRGYNRIYEQGANFLLGMGEGAYDRFAALKGREIHSTFVSIYVSYGIVGLFLWGITILKCILRKNDILYSIICFSGIFLYWLTHNGVRNTVVWMIFTLIAISGYYSMKEGKNE